jgi:fatty acid synthase
MSLHIEKSTVVEENTKNGPPHNQLYGHWDPNETVVISGMSGKFPECDNIQELMDNLFAGVDLITNNDRRWPNGMCAYLFPCLHVCII